VKRPEMLKAGCKSFVISYPKRINDNGDAGEIDYDRATIQLLDVDDAVHKTYYEELLLHEIAHLVNRMCGLRLEEPDVIALVSTLLTLMRENPIVFSWIAGNTK